METGPAVVALAYLESYRLIGFAGGDLAAAYPGFLRAVPENIRALDIGDRFELGHLRAPTRAAGSGGWVEALR